VEAGTPADLLELAAPPGTPTASTLEAALDALTGASWRAKAGGRPVAAMLGDLAGEPTSTAPILALDTRASLLVLRPREEGALDAGRLEIEAVLLDGRAPGGGD
jgi:hypothetical protein